MSSYIGMDMMMRLTRLKAIIVENDPSRCGFLIELANFVKPKYVTFVISRMCPILCLEFTIKITRLVNFAIAYTSPNFSVAY